MMGFAVPLAGGVNQRSDHADGGGHDLHDRHRPVSGRRVSCRRRSGVPQCADLVIPVSSTAASSRTPCVAASPTTRPPTTRKLAEGAGAPSRATRTTAPPPRRARAGPGTPLFVVTATGADAVAPALRLQHQLDHHLVDQSTTSSSSTTTSGTTTHRPGATTTTTGPRPAARCWTLGRRLGARRASRGRPGARRRAGPHRLRRRAVRAGARSASSWSAARARGRPSHPARTAPVRLLGTLVAAAGPGPRRAGRGAVASPRRRQRRAPARPASRS